MKPKTKKDFPKKGTKAVPFCDIKEEGEKYGPRVKVGIGAVTGNVDSGNDRIHAGAFAKSLKEQTGRIRHLWGHESWSPPTAVIKEVEEIGFEELPSAVLDKYPDGGITGGVKVTREYLNTPKGDEILEGINKDAINEMSFAYEVLKADFSEEDGSTIRELRELRVYEFSDVNWGMNSATIASGAKHLFSGSDLPIGFHYQQFKEILEALKEGRELTGSEAILLKALASDIRELDLDTKFPDLDPEIDDTKKGDDPEEKAEDPIEDPDSLFEDWAKKEAEIFG